MLGSEIMVLIGVILSFHVTSTYTVPQYVTSALITFVSAEVLEGNIYLKKENKKTLLSKKDSENELLFCNFRRQPRSPI